MAYISEISYAGGRNSDFVEVAVAEGTDTSGWTILVYNNGGNVTETVSFGASVTTIDGQDIYLFEGAGGLGSIRHNNAVALVDDTGGVLQFVSFGGNTVTGKKGDAGGATSTNIGSSDPGDSLSSIDDGNSYTSTSSTPGTVPCFGPGTLIATPNGLTPVDDLEAGDLVTVSDGRVLPIVWKRASSTSIDPDDGNWPILVSQDALGPGRPSRDLVLSGQHRVLVGPGGALSALFAEQYLVPAKALVTLPGIREMKGRRSIRWFHFALQTHSVITAEGCSVESLFLGRMVLGHLGKRERLRLCGLFPSPQDRADGLNGPRAAPFLTVGETGRRLQQSAKSVA